jgi:predicted Holliday junction resolvase-like endonuclease
MMMMIMIMMVMMMIIIIIIIITVTITEKQNKFQELANEICAMWKHNAAQVISLVISSTGVISKSLSHSLKTFNLHPNTYIQTQKSVILGKCSILRNFIITNKTIQPIAVDYISQDR